MVYLMKKDVLRLEVPMQHIVLMHIFHPKTDLPHVFPHSPLRKPADFLHVVVKILPKAWLEDQIGAILIDEEVIKPDDVRMVEETLDLDFSDQL